MSMRVILIVIISLSALLGGGVVGYCNLEESLSGNNGITVEVATNESRALVSPITYRWEEVCTQIGEERVTKLRDLLKNSQDIIDAWGCGSYEDEEPIGTRLYPGVVLDKLNKDYDQFKKLFSSELQEIEQKTNGKRFKADANGNKQNPIPDDTSAMLFDINTAYEGAIAEMEIVVYPKTGTNTPDLTRTPAVRTEFEHARDVFQRYGYYLFSGKLEGEANLFKINQKP